jgi:chaperonin cofactor prefoldin
MAKKLPPAKLREKARELLELAKIEESKQYEKVGRLAVKTLNKKGAFVSEDVEELKAEIQSLKGKINTIFEI